MLHLQDTPPFSMALEGGAEGTRSQDPRKWHPNNMAICLRGQHHRPSPPLFFFFLPLFLSIRGPVPPGPLPRTPCPSPIEFALSRLHWLGSGQQFRGGWVRMCECVRVRPCPAPTWSHFGVCGAVYVCMRLCVSARAWGPVLKSLAWKLPTPGANLQTFHCPSPVPLPRRGSPPAPASQ